MTKKILLSIFTFAIFSSVFSQTVAITANTGTSQNILIGYSKYHAIEAIYLGSEITTSNFITTGTAINHIDFSFSTAASVGVTLPLTITNYSIYLKNVPTATTTLATSSYSTTGYTLVYTGNLTITADGWNGVDLTTPFKRTANSNLQILCLRQDGVFPVGYAAFNAATGNSALSTNLTSRRYNDSIALVSGTTSLTASRFRPAIQLKHRVPLDATFSNALLPSASCYNTNQSISLVVSNDGTTTPIPIGAASVQLTITGANPTVVTKTNTTAIAANGGTETIVFSGLNLNAAGTNTITALVTATGDGNNADDTLKTSLTTAQTINFFPIDEGAEAPLTAFKYLKSLNLSSTNSFWYRLTSNYGNPYLSDSIMPNNGSAYYFYHSFAAKSGYRGLLYSDCISLPTSSTNSISFWMTHDSSFSSSLDSVYVSVSTDKALTWTRVAGFQRYDPNMLNVTYAQHSADISAYAGQTIQIAFEGVSKAGNSFGLDDISIQSVLPVTLSSFTGTREGTKNVLKWETVNETNNKGFELQRSINGKDFGKIGYIDSKATNGSSSSKLNYSFNDETPFAATTNYYRLRQLDKNGKEAFSNVVALKSAQISKAEISSVYPNPVQDKLNIILNTPSTEKVNIVITDLVGKTISSKTLETLQGDNNIQFNTTQLAKGTYFIKVYSSSNSELATQKFVKL